MTNEQTAIIMSRARQRNILNPLVDSYLMHDNWGADIVDTMTTALSPGDQIRPHKEFFYVLDMDVSEEKRSALCAKYERSMEGFDPDWAEEAHETVWLEAVTGKEWPDVDGVTVVVADQIDNGTYTTMSDYCAEHNVTPEEIAIEITVFG